MPAHTGAYNIYYRGRRRFCKMGSGKERKKAKVPRLRRRKTQNREKTREDLGLHFLPGCAILHYTESFSQAFGRCAIVAQLDRAFGSDPEGQRFESSRSHQNKSAGSQDPALLFLRKKGF